MIAVDTNLLVYAHRSSLPEHAAATRALERAAVDLRGWGFAAAVAAEFWSVVTHPSAVRPSSPERARSFLVALEAAGARAWSPTSGFAGRLARLAAEREVRGSRVFDLQIALMAAEAGATELWSHDRAFLTLPGLRLHDPLEGS